MLYAVCCVPIASVRKEPSHSSEMTSQLLFGECCKILLTEKEWVLIQCQLDEYEGWCQLNQITEIGIDDFLHAKKDMAFDWVNELKYNGMNMRVPFGSNLTGVVNGKAEWKRNSIVYEGKVWEMSKAQRTAKSVRGIAFRYLNTAYLWGGRSVFGVDCSGFTQMVFKFFSLPLPRDSAHQSEKGEVIGFLQEAKLGDLAFFDDDEGNINHVGILLSDFEIIHAAGKVRIDKIDNQGILNVDTAQRTHKLRIIKRVF